MLISVVKGASFIYSSPVTHAVLLCCSCLSLKLYDRTCILFDYDYISEGSHGKSKKHFVSL